MGSLGGHWPTEIGVCDEESIDDVIEQWSDRFVEIVWVNAPLHSALDMVHLTYGNQAGVDALYSHAALLVTIPALTSDETEE
ncbi:uncharacterized protein K460DRAFT_400250 [Cucurbitaria berberidis CBS 394.84]|uniref:Uncharacterized protein n=1 Tax=Cucurbitaria berberidis CBS 394.84 TaxID=1168544 RepID=A0A9P4GR31_9PLEO|nr:uncharacterized protein K460DRAFT_400250 [Cucurbitaria berberidis CBS 394.84]KAF1850170.1 hypothetical protein K460DRAFT_400250 [Cucurbitaria berberidis CBS 394.84]